MDRVLITATAILIMAIRDMDTPGLTIVIMDLGTIRGTAVTGMAATTMADIMAMAEITAATTITKLEA